MDKYIFTDEEINKILLHSPMALPSSPASYGLKGSNIKSFFYDYIRQLMLLINDRFILIERDKNDTISAHSANTEAHTDIRKLITDLDEANTYLAEALSAHINQAKSDMSSHNTDTKAHMYLQGEIMDVKRTAENALNFASGKSKIIPVRDAFEMIAGLSQELNIGDKFVLSDKNVPDFTLFEKNSTNSNAVEFTQADLLLGSIEFLPGESYITGGYLLVASESGIDTSKLARAEAIDALNLIINEAITELSKKENSISSVTEASETVTINNDTEYDLGLRTSIILNLPDEIPTDYECIINFRSGYTPTGLDTPSSIIFTQDDCLSGKLYPVSNRLYEINIKNVGGVLIAKVGACDYAIL